MYRVDKRINGFSSENTEKIYSLIAEIDALKGLWHLVGNVVPQIMSRLTESVIITSSGSSNRIEGNRLSDNEVMAIYRNINIKKFKTRDEQEIAGYLESLQFIFENYEEIAVSESNILWLHKEMLKYCDKDERHRGIYKIAPNRVEARDSAGNLVGVIFDPTPPHLVRKEIGELVDWVRAALAFTRADPASTSNIALAHVSEAREDTGVEAENGFNVTLTRKHPLIVIANFIFEYLAIHPFQDGNGRTSRLLSNLMLLRSGYHFVKIASHEQIIESNKAEYYKVLNYTQTTWKTAHEDVSQWILFFLNIVRMQSTKAIELIKRDNFEQLLSEKQLMVWNYILSIAPKEFSRKKIAEVTNIPAVTVESIIKKFLNMNKIMKLGQGRATRYRKINE